MKLLFYLAFNLFCFLLCFGQTWKDALDSCMKYQKQHQYKKAIQWGDKALELYEKQIAIKDTNYSNILNRQVENCYYAGFYEIGEQYAKKDSAWAREANNEVRYAAACSNLGALYSDMGRYTEAERLYKEVLKYDAKLLGTDHPDYATSCNNLAFLYRDLGRYAEAEPLYKEALNIRAKTLGKDHPSYATSCNNLASLYEAQGWYEQAESLFKEALLMREKVRGREHPEYASSCNNLASLYQSQGRYSEAEPLYKQAMTINAKVLGKKHPDYALSCRNLGILYEIQGRYLEAEPLYKEALEIYARTLGKKHIHYANTSSSLSGLYRNQGRYSEAETLLKESQQIIAKVFGKNHTDYANSCNNLAYLYKIQGRYTEAEELYKEAMEIRSKILGTQHPEYAQSCSNLASLYDAQQKYSEAENLYKESLQIRLKIYGTSHPSYTGVCNNLAIMYKKLGRHDEAEPLFKEVIKHKLKEIAYNFKNLSETEKESYIKANAETYFDNFQLFVAVRYKDNPAISVDAYKVAIETKGLILQSTEKVKNRILRSKDENLKKLYSEWKQTKDNYVKAVNMTVEQREKKQIRLDSLEKQFNELEKELALKSEEFAKTFTSTTVTWKDIQKSLKKNQAAVEIIRMEAKNPKNEHLDSIMYMAVLIKKTSLYPEIVIIPYGAELEKEYLTCYHRSIKAKIPDEYSYNAFWKLLKNALKGVNTVYFSADGVYHKINLATLQNPETQKYLSDEITLIYVTNTKDILAKRTFTSSKSYCIGNPKFELGIDTQNNVKSDEQQNIGNLPQLDGAEREVKQISTFLPHSIAITGDKATEEYVKSIKNPRVLHIATHGYFKKEEYQSSVQAMLNAGLFLAGVVDYDRMEVHPLDKEDGKLTAFEVMNMELDDTELVVLSACETGLGHGSKEGIYGLQRAFKVAGAQTIIMSLWKVSDEATQLLMTKFYENWQKKYMNKRKAFETAQKEIQKIYKEPYYWGAFVMIE